MNDALAGKLVMSIRAEPRSTLLLTSVWMSYLCRHRRWGSPIGANCQHSGVSDIDILLQRLVSATPSGLQPAHPRSTYRSTSLLLKEFTVSIEW
jgi:hypothetical protein